MLRKRPSVAWHLGPCNCLCHACVPWTIARENVPNVDAVTACRKCENRHCGVLLETTIWDEPYAPLEQPAPAMFVYQADGEEGG